MPRQEPRATLIVTVLLTIAVAYGGWRVYDDVRQRPYRQLEVNLREVQRAVERYAVDTEGAYPERLEELIERGYLDEWPENPFQPGEPMPIQEQGEPAQPGALVYVAWGPLITMSDPKAEQLPILPTELDSYMLFAYGERLTGRTAPPADQIERFEDARAGVWRVGEPYEPLYWTPAGIDWPRVHAYVTAGEGMDAN